MKEGDFVLAFFSIGLDHQFLIEVNSRTVADIFNIILAEKLNERCMKCGAGHSIITISSYIRIVNSYWVSIDGIFACVLILSFYSGEFGQGLKINVSINSAHHFVFPTPLVR